MRTREMWTSEMNKSHAPLADSWLPPAPRSSVWSPSSSPALLLWSGRQAWPMANKLVQGRARFSGLSFECSSNLTPLLDQLPTINCPQGSFEKMELLHIGSWMAVWLGPRKSELIGSYSTVHTNRNSTLVYSPSLENRGALRKWNLFSSARNLTSCRVLTDC